MQQYQARQNYIQAEVHTATPQKLQLLLVEAAIKNIHRTKQAWKNGKFEDGFETLARAQDIVAEILSSLDIEGNPDIAKKLAAIYVFIFRRLAEGGMAHQEEKLDDALRVLESERETWRLVCEKFGSSSVSAQTSQGAATLDLSSEAASGQARILVRTAGNEAPTPTVSRPAGIQTDASLAAKPAPAPNSSPPIASSPSSGNNWEA